MKIEKMLSIQYNLNDYKSVMCLDTDDLNLQNYLLKCLNEYKINNTIESKIILNFNNSNDILIKKNIENLKLNFNNFKNILITFGVYDGIFVDLSSLEKIKNVSINIYSNFHFNFKFSNNVKFIDLRTSEKFNNPIGNLPSKLKKIVFGDDFNNKFELPEELEELHLGYKFNQPVNNLPSKLKILSFDVFSKFNQLLDNLPLNLKKLYIGEKFANSLDYLPSNIKTISFSEFSSFNSSIDNLPNGLKKISFNKHFSQSINNLPDAIEELVLVSNYNVINKFPSSLKKLKINFDQIESINLLYDSSIEELIIMHDLKLPITDDEINLKKFKIPKSLKKLKIISYHFTKKSWLYEFAKQNNYYAKNDILDFYMCKIK